MSDTFKCLFTHNNSIVRVRCSYGFKVSHIFFNCSPRKRNSIRRAEIILSINCEDDINHFKRKIDSLTYWTEEELNLLDESIKNNDITDAETKYPELSRELGPDIFDFIYKE